MKVWSAFRTHNATQSGMSAVQIIRRVIAVRKGKVMEQTLLHAIINSTVPDEWETPTIGRYTFGEVTVRVLYTDDLRIHSIVWQIRARGGTIVYPI